MTPAVSDERKKAPLTLTYVDKFSANQHKVYERKKKLDLVCQKLIPIPFAPGPAPDLPRHEPLFRALGLWDFLHLDLTSDPLRPDLLASLIAHYYPPSRRSEIGTSRIAVGRTDLARALSLPVKKPATPLNNDLLTLFAAEETAAVLTDFMSDWLVLLEDACAPPPEVVVATNLVKEGRPHKVDWTGLVWAMVKKELLDAPSLGKCYYASHLQRLVKYQCPRLFEDPPIYTLKAPKIEDYPDNSSPGSGAAIDTSSSHSLQLCSLTDSVSKEGEDRGGRAEERPTMEGSIVYIEEAPEPLSSFSFGDNCKRHKDGIDDADEGNLHNRICSDGPWDIEQVQCLMEEAQKAKMVLVEKEQECANARRELQYMNSMLKQKDQNIQSLQKARMEEVQKDKIALLEKEQACANAQMEMGYMNNMLQQKDEIIRSLEKAGMEEAQKRELQASRLAHELRVMSHTVDGYKKDLKEKEEMSDKAAGVIDYFERKWSVKFTECADLIPKLAIKFMELNEDLELLKETYATPKTSETENSCGPSFHIMSGGNKRSSRCHSQRADQSNHHDKRPADHDNKETEVVLDQVLGGTMTIGVSSHPSTADESNGQSGHFRAEPSLKKQKTRHSLHPTSERAHNRQLTTEELENTRRDSLYLRETPRPISVSNNISKSRKSLGKIMPGREQIYKLISAKHVQIERKVKFEHFQHTDIKGIVDFIGCQELFSEEFKAYNNATCTFYCNLEKSKDNKAYFHTLVNGKTVKVSPRIIRSVLKLKHAEKPLDIPLKFEQLSWLSEELNKVEINVDPIDYTDVKTMVLRKIVFDELTVADAVFDARSIGIKLYLLSDKYKILTDIVRFNVLPISGTMNDVGWPHQQLVYLLGQNKEIDLGYIIYDYMKVTFESSTLRGCLPYPRLIARICASQGCHLEDTEPSLEGLEVIDKSYLKNSKASQAKSSAPKASSSLHQ